MYKNIKLFIPKLVLKIYQKYKVIREFSKIKTILKKNYRIFNDRETVIIIGNGPSINKLNIQSLCENTDVIVMNSFYKHTQADKFKIVAYCVGELGADVSKFDIKKVLDINSQNYWFSSDFIPYIFPFEKNIFIYMPGDDDQLKIKNKKINLSKPAPNYETTAQMSIIVALAMGYKNILLIGFDHNFLACGQFLDHFYDDEIYDIPSNMFVGGADYQSLMQNCNRMWSRYKLINSYASYNGVEIINCGSDSYLDVFRRGSLEKNT
jgi:hypothetical protein